MPPTEPAAAPATEPVQPTITNPPPVEENPTEKRIKALSGKVETASKERDESIVREQTATKLAQFAESFIDIVVANPAAKDFKDQIKEKVMSGYSVQDAAYAVLGPAGKLGNQQPMMPIAGGSAPTVIQNNNLSKPVDQMTREEMKAALQKAQEKGDFFLS